MAYTMTQEEWECQMAEKILQYVRNELYLELRFMDIAISALIPRENKALHTFATDGTMLFFSTEQILRVFRSNAAFLDRAYLHTVLHCIFSHLWIGGNRDPRRWQIACDIAVEYTIDGMDKACTKRILSWSRQQFYQELREKKEGVSAAVIYRMLGAYEEDETGRERLAALEQEFYTDDHRYWPKREDSEAKREAAVAARKKWNKIARQTRQQSEQRGDDPKEGEELLASQLSAERGRRSYREFLQKFAVRREELHCDPDEFDLNYYSYGLRMYGNMPLIEPQETKETKKIREFVIVIDTSYSTSGELVKEFLKETVDILLDADSFFTDSRVRILQCDNQVRSDHMITDRRQLVSFLNEFQLIGGGGTDFRPAFSYVNELAEQGAFWDLSGLLYFTDGKGSYPKKRPAYRSAFLFLEEYDEEAVPPWAMRLRLEPEEFEGRSKKHRKEYQL